MLSSFSSQDFEHGQRLRHSAARRQGKPRARAGVFTATLLMVSAATLSACSTGSQHAAAGTGAAAPSSPTSSSSPTATPVHPAPIASAPPPGTVLATSNNAFDTVTSGGDGFAILDQIVTSSDQSTVTIYDVAGHQLSRIPPGKISGGCGAVDITVPGMGRLILTEEIIGKPAQGINPASYSAVMQAWLAKSGSLAWTTTVLPPQSQNLFCGSGLGSDFTSTSNGAWGLFSDGPEFVINLRTGALRSDQNALGLLGNYVVDAPSTSSGPTSTDLITDPATGKTVGSFTQVHDDSCITGAVQLPQGLDLASFGSSTAGVSPPTGISTDGKLLLAIRPVPESNHCHVTVAGYSPEHLPRPPARGNQSQPLHRF